MSLPQLFPALMPNETIHSAVSRYHLLSGHASVLTSLVELFGNRATSIASDFPSGLGQLMALPGNARLIEGHTLLPLFSPFLGTSRSEAIRSHMLAKAEKSLKLVSGVMNAGFERYRAWRFCPDCMLEDFSKYGLAYWHVIHQAAGVQACPEHRIPLLKLSIYGQVLGITPLMLPRSSEIQASARAYCFNATQLEKAVDVATLLYWGLSHPADVAQLLSRNFLNFVLFGKGLIHRNRIKARQLEHLVENSLQDYPPDDEFQRLGAQCQCCPPWILGMIRRQDRTHHPLLYFALLDLLDVGVSDLNAFIQRGEVSGEASSSRVVETDVCRKVSQETLAQRRAQFSADTRDGSFRKANAYSWLYRNDREWLSAYVRSHPRGHGHRERVDWMARDEVLSQEIQRARTEILSYAGKPTQITQRSLARHLCLPLSIWRRIDLLPLTAKALLRSEESAHDFQLRLVKWASRNLAESSVLHTRSAILRRAGVRVLRLNEAELVECCS